MLSISFSSTTVPHHPDTNPEGPLRLSNPATGPVSHSARNSTRSSPDKGIRVPPFEIIVWAPVFNDQFEASRARPFLKLRKFHSVGNTSANGTTSNTPMGPKPEGRSRLVSKPERKHHSPQRTFARCVYSRRSGSDLLSLTPNSDQGSAAHSEANKTPVEVL